MTSPEERIASIMKQLELEPTGTLGGDVNAAAASLDMETGSESIKETLARLEKEIFGDEAPVFEHDDFKLPEPFATDARKATLGRELLDADNFIGDIIGPEPKREQVDGPEFELWHKRASKLRALLASPEIADMYQRFVAAEAEYDELEQLWKKTLV